MFDISAYGLIVKLGAVVSSGMKSGADQSHLRAFLMIGASVAGFSSFVYNLFGSTIPSVFWVHMKEIGAALVMLAVFVFAVAWLLKAKPHKRPQKYMIKVFDVFGHEFQIEGIRTEFKTHDVAWSFMKNYKKSYPLYNFALVSDLPNSEKMTIFRYL